jgi:protein involved in polysaccharide export with SLBB domain
MLTGDQIPTDDVVDPVHYRLGPGDVLAYQTTGLDLTEKLLVVTPENMVLIERMGAISVADMSLAEFRTRLQELFRQRSANLEVTVSLRRARLIYVSLSGAVAYPGTYTVPASMRVSTFLNVTRHPWTLTRDGSSAEMARAAGSGGLAAKSTEVARTPVQTYGPYASRNIVVRHRRGASMADLARARAGDASSDPHLREGDEVFVPIEDPTSPLVSISGAVAQPTVLAYKNGDRLSTLLAGCSGLTSDADASKVVIVHPDAPKPQNVSIDATTLVPSEDVELRPGTMVIIERKGLAGQGLQQGVVHVHGEVNRPGSVVITPGATRLSTVIEQSGGVTSRAALGLSYVVRPEKLPPTLAQMRDEANRSFQYSDLKLEDTTRYNYDQKYKTPYVSCDIEAAVKRPNSTDDPALLSGDVVVIVANPERVYVYGQVNRPGYVQYVPNKPMEWYVERAGGYATGSEEDRARIIRGRSRVWVQNNDGVIVEPGDEVYVPRPPDVPIGTEIQTFSVIASIVTSLAVLAITVINVFFNK